MRAVIVRQAHVTGLCVMVFRFIVLVMIMMTIIMGDFMSSQRRSPSGISWIAWSRLQTSALPLDSAMQGRRRRGARRCRGSMGGKGSRSAAHSGAIILTLTLTELIGPMH